nr:MAG TPA: hypothetical protein [Caudoviricetes sp.]DAT23632.1 MAG TPA: hypothetical protein [Caudoviricetes sp.]DAX89736.1 MAG TPA: hypothetical protein [Caudoviricetes sp.]
MKYKHERQVNYMAFVPTILKPVHVRAYWRFRLFRWEFVHEHWRSLPNR